VTQDHLDFTFVLKSLPLEAERLRLLEVPAELYRLGTMVQAEASLETRQGIEKL
jgi:hypothetical protein